MEDSTSLEALVPAAVALLAVVADPVRWRLLAHLADRRTRCVCDLQPVAAVAPNLLSYHLKVLREAGLVTARRRGRWIDYTIAPDGLARLHAALPVPDPAAGRAATACCRAAADLPVGSR